MTDSSQSEPGVKQQTQQLLALLAVGIGIVSAILIVRHAAFTATTYIGMLDHLLAAFLVMVAGVGLSYGVSKL